MQHSIHVEAPPPPSLPLLLLLIPLLLQGPGVTFPESTALHTRSIKGTYVAETLFVVASAGDIIRRRASKDTAGDDHGGPVCMQTFMQAAGG